MLPKSLLPKNFLDSTAMRLIYSRRSERGAALLPALISSLHLISECVTVSLVQRDQSRILISSLLQGSVV
jgi:hypothetical protein